MQVVFRKIGPKSIGKIELRVRKTEEQKVRNALLAARANHQIGISHGERRHASMHEVCIYLGRVEGAFLHLLRELARNRCDLLVAAVAEGEGQGHGVVVAACLFQRLENGPHNSRQATQIANGVEANAACENFVVFRQEKVSKKLHQGVDLEFGALPILLTKSVQRERFYAETAARANHAPHRAGTFAMPDGPGKASLLSPSAIAIHDDGNVRGEVARFDKGRHRHRTATDNTGPLNGGM